MRILIALCALTVLYTTVLCQTAEVQQCLIDSQLYPTGVDASFNVLPNQSPMIQDPHWEICASTHSGFATCWGAGAPSPCCPAGVVNSLPGAWVNPTTDPAFPASNWIETTNTANQRHATFTFSRNFTVPEGCDNPSFSGKCWSDNDITARTLNGNPIALNCSVFDQKNYTTGPTFTLDSSNGVVSGTNTLQITVRNYGGPFGLLVNFHDCESCRKPCREPVIARGTAKDCNETVAIEEAEAQAHRRCKRKCERQGYTIADYGECLIKDRDVYNLSCCEDSTLTQLTVSCACCCDCDQAPTFAPTLEPTLAPTVAPTAAPTTRAPTTRPPTTRSPTTLAPTVAPTAAPTTRPPTTRPPTTRPPTTRPPTTKPPTTRPPTTRAPVTKAPVTKAPVPTEAPFGKEPTPEQRCCFYDKERQQCVDNGCEEKLNGKSVCKQYEKVLPDGSTEPDCLCTAEEFSGKCDKRSPDEPCLDRGCKEAIGPFVNNPLGCVASKDQCICAICL